jgi:hypothetical protein
MSLKQRLKLKQRLTKLTGYATCDPVFYELREG